MQPEFVGAHDMCDLIKEELIGFSTALTRDAGWIWITHEQAELRW